MKEKKYPFTKDEMLKAYNVSVIPLAEQFGYIMKKENDVYRISGNGGLFLWENGLGYFHSATQDKGNNVDFLLKYCNIKRPFDAIKMLLECAEIMPEMMKEYESREKGDVILPKKFNGRYDNLFWYLPHKRGIDKGIVAQMVKDHRIYQDVRRNCVFVGFDNDDNPRYAALKGTAGKFSGEVRNSDKCYPFAMPGKSTTLFVFEAPIDALSHATMYKMKGLDWTQDHRIAGGGISSKSVIGYLESNSQITNVVFCYDNDYLATNDKGEPTNHGQLGVKAVAQRLREKGFNQKLKKVLPSFPYKDFNEELVDMVKPKTLERSYSNANSAEMGMEA